MPHPPGLGGPSAVPRVVMRADDADAVRMLGVDRWVEVQTPSMSGQHLLRLKVPFWLLTETGSYNGKPLSNLAIAKRLAETLLLVRSKLSDVAYGDKEQLVDRFAGAVHDPTPPPLCDAQCLSLMELADAWRDHIVSTWGNPSELLSLERISPMPLLTEKVMNEEGSADPPPPPPPPKLDPKEFPALGLSPCRSPPRIPFGYSKVLMHRKDGARHHHQYVPKVRLDDAEALGRVAWIGDPECKEAIWLRGGPLPQKIDWGPRVR
jgi:hypothetical protein